MQAHKDRSYRDSAHDRIVNIRLSAVISIIPGWQHLVIITHALSSAVSRAGGNAQGSSMSLRMKP